MRVSQRRVVPFGKLISFRFDGPYRGGTVSHLACNLGPSTPSDSGGILRSLGCEFALDRAVIASSGWKPRNRLQGKPIGRL